MALVPESEMLNMGTKIIAVRVGPEPYHADFTIHEDLVRKSSLFFQAALSHEWRESQERIVKLPACHIAAFKLYTQWLYTGRLYALPAGPNASLQESSNLVRGFFIGDYVQDVNFQDSIIDALIEWNRKTGVTQREGILNAWVRTVLQKTSRFGPLHKLLVDVTVWDASHTWWVSEAANFPIEFVQDVAIGLSMRCKAGGVSSSLRAGLSHCKYHSHGDKPCYRAEQPGENPASSATSERHQLLSSSRKQSNNDEKRLVGDYSRPADANAIPDPRTWLRKPSSSHPTKRT